MYPTDTPPVNGTVSLLMLDRVRATVQPHPLHGYAVERATIQYGPHIRTIVAPGGVRRVG